MAYFATGFTPEQEAELLAMQKKQGEDLTEVVESTRHQETLRTITTVSIVAGLIYTLAQMGNLFAQVRARRKSSP